MNYLVALCFLDQFNCSQSMYFYKRKCIKNEIKTQGICDFEVERFYANNFRHRN